MKHRVPLALIGLLALSLIACSLFSNLTGKVQETAEAAVTSVAATVAALPTATSQPAPTATTADEAAPTATTGVEVAPTATTAAESPGEGGEETGEGTGVVVMAGLDELQSYRADWTTRLIYPGEEGGTVALTYKLEWTRDPPAQHMWMDMGDSPSVEAIWAEDKVWVKAGDRWIEEDAPEAAQSFEDFLQAFDVQDEMTLVGTETINGIRCKHYVYDWESPDGSMKHHRELWVADDPSLPKVGIRVLFRMENVQQQGSFVTETEALLYDLNQPITIEPPN